MFRGILRCATVVILLCSSAASASMILTPSPSGSPPVYLTEIRSWDQIEVSAGRYSTECVEELPDPTGLMHLVFIGKVVSGKGEFCVQYDDGTKMVRTAAQSLGHGTFGLQVSLPCIPSETILYLDATHPKKPLLIESASLYIMTARMPEPSTIGLLALALGGVLLRRRG